MVAVVLVRPQVQADAEAVGDAVADLVLDRIRTTPSTRPFLLGCPGGRSLQTTYRRLAGAAAAELLDLSRLVIVMMDEYVLPLRGGFEPVHPTELHSCRRFGAEEIVGELNRALTAAGAPQHFLVPAASLWLPDPRQPHAYDRRLADAGGVDLFLLASGAGDGHVAFNPPGTDPASRTRVVSLPDSTRRDNLATFPSFGGELAAVPSHGVTVGIATIRELSAEVVMVAHGVDKQEAVRRLAAADRYDAAWPASVVADCRRPHLVVDRAAAGDLVPNAFDVV
jgi:glucosamine-6-phosphate deaminase